MFGGAPIDSMSIGKQAVTSAIVSARPESTLFTNLAALDQGISNLNQPGKVTMVGLYADSWWAGTQATDINTTVIQRFRTKYLDIRNAKIGGSAKSGRGRFGPFHQTGSGAVNGIAGPIIIGGSSGWVKSTSYFTEMFWETLTHPGGVTPGAGTAYAGCYMAMSQVGLVGNAARWLGLLFDATLTGVFRVQFRQGASVVQTGTTGANRYTIVGGVPDPAVGGGDIKLDVTIDPTTASYPDFISFITGHLNSTTMDPTTVWQVCIYRTTNAATSVSIQGFDAHYDEYSAQNTPSSYGATVIADFCRPGKSGEIFQSGAAQYGTNSDYEAQYVADIHIDVHARAYNKNPKFTHTMPVLELAICNFWRNDVLNVETIAGMNPTLWKTRLKRAILSFAKVGIPLVQTVDFGASAAYTCAFPYFDQTTQKAQDYTDATVAAVTECASLKSTAQISGGGCCVRKDLAIGTGGPQSYARRGFYSTADYLHLNDAGQEWESDFLVQLCTNPSSIVPYATTATTIAYEPRSITTRLGINKTTILELDPHKYGSVRLQGGVGFYPYSLRCTDFGQLLSGVGNLPHDGTGIATYQLNQSKSGGATNVIYNMDQFGQRAGLLFDNEAAGAARLQFDLSSLWTALAPSGLTQFSIFFVCQNMRQADLSGPGQHIYWMFGSTADKAANPNSIYSGGMSGHRLMLAAAQGINSGQMIGVMGTTPLTPYVNAFEKYHSPVLGCITVDTTTQTVRTIGSPIELAVNGGAGWKSATTVGIANPWKPDWFSMGGPAGTAAVCAAAAQGGTWLINGIVTDAEYLAIWSQIQGESGGFFAYHHDYTDSAQSGAYPV